MRYLFLIYILISQLCCSAQITSLDLHAGYSYYIGDLNPYKHFNQPKLSGGANLKFSMNKRSALRFGFTYARVAADDANADDAHQNQINRNLHFQSNIFEFSGIYELNFFNYKPGDMQQHPYSPYLFIGLAYYKMNPKAEHNGEYTELQPLGTEGQGTSENPDQAYRLNQLAIPFGLGFRVNMNEKTAIGFEYGVRKLFTDYLDDVHDTYADPEILASENGPLAAEMANQSLNDVGASGVSRGNPNNNDWYFYANITLSIILKGETECGSLFQKKRF